MSYLVEVRLEDGKYHVTHTQFPSVEVSGDSLYAALEEFDKKLAEIDLAIKQAHRRKPMQEAEIIV